MTLALDETSLRDTYGPLIWDAIDAFTTDMSYLAEMVESAGLIEYKRLLWEIRAEAIRRADTPEQAKQITREIMTERGITAPGSRPRQP